MRTDENGNSLLDHDEHFTNSFESGHECHRDLWRLEHIRQAQAQLWQVSRTSLTMLTP